MTSRCLFALRHVLPLLLLINSVAHADPNELAGENWKLVKDRDGIQVYMKHSETSRLKTFRGETILEVEDPFSLVAVFNDYPNMPNWLHFISSVNELSRRSPLDRTIAVETHLPWPLADRDAVVQCDVIQNPETYDVKIVMNNRPDLNEPRPGYVRIPELYGSFEAQILGPGRMLFSYEVILDPGGFVPSWAVNLILRDTPYFTLKRFKRMIVKPEYQGRTFDYVSYPANYRRDANAGAADISDSDNRSQ